jgi:hypothetical protein
VKDYGHVRGRWEQIKERCENKENRVFHCYGGRGIRLSNEFQDVRVFAAYVEALPLYGEKKHLDRIDNERGYERGNLRWVTAKENNRNKRTNTYVVYKGQKMVLLDFIQNHTYLSYNFAREAYHKGASLEELAAMLPGKKSLRRIERERNVSFFGGGDNRT